MFGPWRTSFSSPNVSIDVDAAEEYPLLVEVWSESGSNNPCLTTSSGSSHIIDLTEEDKEGVVDLVGEEEEQAANARR